MMQNELIATRCKSIRFHHSILGIFESVFILLCLIEPQKNKALQSVIKLTVKELYLFILCLYGSIFYFIP
jgi:hypothetical protein